MPDPNQEPIPRRKPKHLSLDERIAQREHKDKLKQEMAETNYVLNLNKQSLLEAWNELKIADVPVQLPMRMANIGKEMTAEEKMNAVDGSSVIAQAQLVTLISKLNNLIVTRQDAIDLAPIVSKMTDSLTKLNVAAVNARVDIANANTGIKAVSGGMFIPRPAPFKPGEQIVLEPDIPEQDAQVNEP
jgi:hypothetical protein